MPRTTSGKGIIRDDLHCNAVRITGGDLERLKVAAGHAAAAGLEVWISPFTNDLTAAELLEFLAGCADHAERLRGQGAEVVLLTGSQLTLANNGIVPGETFEELTPSNPRLGELLAAVPARVNDLPITEFGCLRELLDILTAEGVDSAFVYVFARYDLPHRSDPHLDLDMASAGVVKVLEGRRGRTYPDMAWEPKAAFTTLADYYRA